MLINYLILNIISFVMLILMVLVSVGFLVLLERKILGYMQYRKGPNKVGIIGLFQPFSDAIKLFSKEIFILSDSMIIYYYIMPIIMMMISLMVWMVMPFFSNIWGLKFSSLIMMCFLTLTVYPVMLMGWSSNCNYSMIGAIRAIAQSISYEVNLFLILFNFFIMSFSFKFFEFQFFQEILILFMFFPILLSWMICILAELNRSPFDLVEGESELVSGFNTEYFSWGFALIFMSEYMMIMFFCMVTILLFTNFKIFSLMFFLSYMIMLIIIIYIRGLMPRMRYDDLMYMCWKFILPFILLFLFFFFNYVIFLHNYYLY